MFQELFINFKAQHRLCVSTFNTHIVTHLSFFLSFFDMQGPCLYVECVDMALQSVDLTELLLLKDRAPEPTETVK